MASVALVAGLALLAIVGTTALNARQRASRAAGMEAAPLLLDSEELYVSLADADATASRTFLHAGQEPPGERQRYLDDLQTAANRVAVIGGEVGASPRSREEVKNLTSQLAVYNGLLEEARANNRQSFPVGASYLSQASALMRDDILPQVTELYQEAASRLNDDYRSGTASIEPVVIALVSAVLLSILFWVQRYLTRRTNRIVNPGVALATALVAVVIPWSLLTLGCEQSALVQSQQEGSDAVQVLSAARILMLRAADDESLALIARGTGGAYLTDLDTNTTRLGGADGRGGLLLEAFVIARRTGSGKDVDALLEHFNAFMAAHRMVREFDDSGRYNDAVTTALDTETTAAQALDSGLGRQIGAAQQRLDAHAADARNSFVVLIIAFPSILALAAVVALLGLQRRLGEYQ
jgi:hypothetical protein